MRKARMRKVIALAALGMTLISACTAGTGPDGPQRVVFRVRQGLRAEGPAPVHEILDLGVPGPIHNITDSTVRLRSVQLLSAPSAVHVVNVRAYLWRQVGVGWLIGAFGDLPKQCPREYKPHPVTVVTTKPRSDSEWMVIIALTVSKPGTYHLHKVKMSYVTAGKRGWQYLYFDTVIHAYRGHVPASGC
jgi:hypothetical protein